MLLAIDERRSKIARKSAFDFHLLHLVIIHIFNMLTHKLNFYEYHSKYLDIAECVILNEYVLRAAYKIRNVFHLTLPTHQSVCCSIIY